MAAADSEGRRVIEAGDRDSFHLAGRLSRLDRGNQVARSHQVRKISVRKAFPRSIRVTTKFVEVKSNTTEELGFDWVDATFEFDVEDFHTC